MPSVSLSTTKLYPSNGANPTKTPSCQDIRSLSLIRTSDDSSKHMKSLYDWEKIIPNAAYFVGSDKYLFGNLIAMVYEDPITEKISTVLIARHGENQYNSLTIDARSRYFPACENLLPEYRKSNVRRSLAITALRAYANLDVPLRNVLLENSVSALEGEEINAFDWDETTAGDLATSMHLIVNKIPSQIGEKILNLGYLQQKFSNALMLDIVYIDNENEVDKNNKLVFLLGEQLDSLFDPLTEYSPESTEKIYKVPSDPNTLQESNDNELTESIVQELVKVQTNFTKNLVQFLQNFVVPLRIKVLNNEIPNMTISKLNLIFPPTIDEITRINCIFLDSLKNASPYGSFEVLKACGTTIPYFYKAYMRHEAATKNFTQQLSYFFENYSAYLKPSAGGDKPFIDIEYFTKRKIDSLIHGSLNLIKLKLILNRLMENSQWSASLRLRTEKYYKSAINTIDAFGRDKLKPYNNRVFTPTGKLLTELASDWPTELQYGWLTRRVVAIFGGKNLLCNSFYDEDIIIIFSDHILFLAIDDKDFYRKQRDLTKSDNSDFPSPGFYQHSNDSNFKVHEPSIPDVLMHSLINQIPLANIPRLRVSGWADIGDVYPSTYNEGKMIQFFVLGSGIRKPSTTSSTNVESIKKYQINDVNKLNNGLKLIDLVNKAKILNKSSPFHLFKTKNLGLSIYSTAHEKSVYLDEKSKSPFALFLNMKVNKSLLFENDLFAGLSAHFVKNNTNSGGNDDSYSEYDASELTTIEGDDLVEVFGITRDGSKIHEILPSSEFSTFLAEQLSNLYSNFLSYKNDRIIDYLISANDKLTDFLIQYVDNEDQSQDDVLFETNEESEIEEEDAIGDQGSVRFHQANKDTVEKRKSVIKLLTSPSKTKLLRSKTDLKDSVSKHSKTQSTSSFKPMVTNISLSSKPVSATTSKVTVVGATTTTTTNVSVSHPTEDNVIFREHSHEEDSALFEDNVPLKKNDRLGSKSKETLSSAFTSTNDNFNPKSDPAKTPKRRNDSLIKPAVKTPKEKIVTTTSASQTRSSNAKKKTSFFDKIFRRKQKTPTHIKSPTVNSVHQKNSPVIADITPVSGDNNNNDEDNGNDVKTSTAEPNSGARLSKLGKIFKSSLSISGDLNLAANKVAVPSNNKSSSKVNLKKSPSKESIVTFNTTMDHIINTPYTTPSKQKQQQQQQQQQHHHHNNRKSVYSNKRKSMGTPTAEDRSKKFFVTDNSLDDGESIINAVSTPINSKTNQLKANDFKIRSSTSVNVHDFEEEIDNNSSTIRPVLVDEDASLPAFNRRSASINGSPIPNHNNRKRFSAGSSIANRKRNSKVLSDILRVEDQSKNSRASSMKSSVVKFGATNVVTSARSSFSETGKENYDHLEEIARTKLAKENQEHLMTIKNRLKSVNSNTVDTTNILEGLTTETIGLNNESTYLDKDDPRKSGSFRGSARDSLFVDDYSDYDDDDLKKNWVIARENSSLANIQKVGSLMSNNTNYSDVARNIKSSTSKNWTSLTRETSSTMNVSKYSFKKTESGFSIYNDLMDDSMAPNWIIARDNSTLLNIPKEVSMKNQPVRSMSRSKNIYLTPYQNKIKSSLNSFKSGENLDDDQKIYAMLLSKETFDSMNNISGENNKGVGKNDAKVEATGYDDEDEDENDGYYLTKGGQLSDDEGRFDDDGDDIDLDDEEEEEEDEDNDDDFDGEELELDGKHGQRTDDDEFVAPDNIADDEFEEIKFDKISNSVMVNEDEENDEDEENGPEGQVYQSSLLRGTFGFINHPNDDDFDDNGHSDVIDENLISGFDYDDFDDDDDDDDDERSFDEPKQHGLMSTLPTISSFGGHGENGPMVARGYDSDEDENGLPHSISNLSGGLPRSMSLGGRRSQSFLGILGLENREHLKDIKENGISEDFHNESQEKLKTPLEDSGNRLSVAGSIYSSLSNRSNKRSYSDVHEESH
ncbi:Bud3 protein [Saccharomycopsis crataegensis]|uniref:Bud3 protein n=1 Tax=Saccharomycopsis crataegensis TaxID=43959 RepID=A0AAV5QDW4_9ASCO|nr:Bud3 protein [Saccharomycopsis crataegensis]